MLKILKHYWPEIKKYRWCCIGMLISMFFVVFLDMLFPYYLREFADLIKLNPIENPEVFDSLLNVFYVFVLLFIGLWIGWRFNEFFIVFFESRSMRDVEQRAFDTVQNQSLNFFKESFAGSLAKKVTRFSDSFENITDILYFHFYKEGVKICMVFVIFTLEKPIWGLMFLAWAGVFVVGSYFFAQWKMKFDIESAAADSKVSAAMVDSFSNYFSVKSFAKEQMEFQRFKKVSQHRYLKRTKAWIIQNGYFAFQAAFMIGFELLMYYMVANWWKSGDFTVGDFVFIQTYIMFVFIGVWDFSRHIQRVFQNLANAREMVDIFEIEESIPDKDNAQALSVKQGGIEVKKITFAFPKDNKILFKNLSLSIKPGEKVALVGPSGAGKSTLLKLLFRFYECQKGSICIDGQDIRDVTKVSLRNKMSLVPQNPELFHRTIAENISFGKSKASRMEIEKSAKLAHAHEFIKHMIKKYDTIVGERGVKLSGGEKQRIAIARAFLENSPMLILDEATSALDSLTEKAIQSAILELIENRTSIVIAHRLSTILHMDRIIVLKDGKIVEQGSHKSLLKEKGLYHNLWTHQAGGFLPDV